MFGLTALPLLLLGLAANLAETSDAVQDVAGVHVEAPRAILTGIGFSLSLEWPAGAPPVSYRLETAGGKPLAHGPLVPGETLILQDLEVDSGSDVPLRLTWSGQAEGTTRIKARVLPGWISVLPPLVAIVLALVFKEVVISLFVGVWLGALAFAGLDPIVATMRVVDRFVVPALANEDHAAIIVFSMLLGGMVGIMGRSGGTRGIIKAVQPIATSARRAQLAAYLGGLAIFFDDYANTLIVGHTMRPITDRMRVSREKLAYIVDSTAAPVAAIVFVSTWVGFEISLIGDGLKTAAETAGTSPEVAAALNAANPFTVFLHTIPYLFYPILALIMVGLIVATRRDFGPMLKAERRAARGEGLYREGAVLMTDTSSGAMEPAPETPHRWFNAVLPVLTVVAVVLLGLVLGGREALGRPGTVWEVLGAANAFHALLWGSLAGCLVATGLAVGQRLLAIQAAIGAWLAGVRAMLLAFVILVLAWALGDVTGVLGTATYLSGFLEGALRPELLPALIFVTASAISFATGTSWGTMAILVPIVIPLAVTLGATVGFETGSHYVLLLGAVSSVLAGAIFGDHCSPISDTTVLSSMASACDHVDHVRTQLPYALTVAGLAVVVGSVPTAFGMNPLFSYPLGGMTLFLLLRFIGQRDDAPETAS